MSGVRASAVLFDLDGTLVDSLPDIAAALDVALVHAGAPRLSLAEVAGCVGEGARHLVTAALPPTMRVAERIETTLAVYRAAYRENLVVHTRPYPGIELIVDALRERGVPIGVVTNKPHEPAVLIVERVFGRGRFGAIVGEDERRPKKPDPAPAFLALEALGAPRDGVVFVGDSAVDIETARRGGFRGIGVAWGIRGRAELEGVAAAEIVEDTAELARALGL